MSGHESDPSSNGARPSVAPPGFGGSPSSGRCAVQPHPARTPAAAPEPGRREPASAGIGTEELTPAQAEAIAKVAEMAAARPSAAADGLSRAAKGALVALGILVFALLLLALLVS